MNQSQGGTASVEEVEQIVDRLEDLEDTVEDQQEQIDELETENERLQEENERLREENERLQERVDDLERELDERAPVRWDSSDHTDMVVESTEGNQYPIGTVVERKVTEYDVEDLIEDLAEGDLQEDVEEHAEPSVERETPLEDVVALPEDVAERSLSENQLRARFIALDVESYGEACIAGRVIRAGRVGRVLRAGLDVEPHPETVARVMEILDDLGGEQTKLRKRNGEKRIAFDEDLVERLHRLRDVEAHTEMSQGTG